MTGAEEQRPENIETEGHGNSLSEALGKAIYSARNKTLKEIYGVVNGSVCKVQSIQGEGTKAKMEILERTGGTEMGVCLLQG